MSFLSPMLADVKVYKSSDKDAPHLDYTRRSAGDVKTILKACLVTGYGDKQGAGWQIQDETDTTAGFWIDNPAMSDYCYKIDDSGQTAIRHSYSYQNVTPSSITNSGSLRNSGNINGAKNHWYVLASDYGFFYIECFLAANGLEHAHFMYFGRVKSALISDSPINIAFINTSVGGSNSLKAVLSNAHYRLSNLTSFNVSGAGFNASNQSRNNSMLSITSPLYLMSDGDAIGQLVGMQHQSCPIADNFGGVSDDGSTLDLHVLRSTQQWAITYGMRVLIDMKSWEF